MFRINVNENEDKREEIDRIESILLQWTTASAVFVITGVALSTNERIGKWVSILMFAIAVYLFSALTFEYLNERGKLEVEGGGFIRPDLIIFSVVLSIPILLWFMYEESVGEV